MIRTAVIFGYGINCQDETEYACRKAGFPAVKKIHLNKFLWSEEKLEDYHLLIIPGGFSGGDQLGAGVFFALKMERLREDILEFVKDGKLILGICNGWQVLVNLKLLPGYLTYNDCGNFQDRWVHLIVNQNSPCVFTRGIKGLDLPIRHGEGKYWASAEDLKKLKKKQQIVLQYALGNGLAAQGVFPFNPNGSLDDIAGLSDESGRVCGIMPHPEAFIDWTNHPQWTRWKEKAKRFGLGVTKEGVMSRLIFSNALHYLEEKF